MTSVEMAPPRRATKAEKRSQRQAVKAEKEELRRGKELAPRTARQAELLAALDRHSVVFALGPAGTGKTYLGARHALARLVLGDIERIAITRPTVSAPRHRLGFQPGNAKAKLAPWMVPIMDALTDGLSGAQIDRMVENKQIEGVPFEFMRGRTIRDGVFMLDEAQNCTLSDLELFVTRIGENGQLVICGDPDQADIDDSGLVDLVDMAERYGVDAGIVRFSEEDVVRSKTAAQWVKAFKAARRQGLPV